MGSALVALLLAELLLRLFGVAAPRWAQRCHLETDDKRRGLDLYPDDPDGRFPVDLREQGVRARYALLGLGELQDQAARTPHGVDFRYTAALCRGAAPPPRDPRRPRVVVIGDSFTEGQGVPEEAAFPARLAARAEVEAINCGRRGYNFPELRGWFERHLELAPDVMIYALTLNDIEQSERFHRQQAFLDDWILDRRRMLHRDAGAPPWWRSRLYALVLDRIEGARVGAATTRWYRGMVGADNAEGWRATQEHVVAMDEEMRARGGRLVVVLWPLLVDLDAAYPFEGLHETLRDAFRARGVRVVDALPAFRGASSAELWVHPIDRHPNARAHARMATLLELPLRAALAELPP